MRPLLLVCLLLCCHATLRAQEHLVESDSLGRFKRMVDRHTSTQTYRMTFIGVPLIVGGVVMQRYDADFAACATATASRSTRLTTTTCNMLLRD